MNFAGGGSSPGLVIYHFARQSAAPNSRLAAYRSSAPLGSIALHFDVEAMQYAVKNRRQNKSGRDDDDEA